MLLGIHSRGSRLVVGFARQSTPSSIAAHSPFASKVWSSWVRRGLVRNHASASGYEAHVARQAEIFSAPDRVQDLSQPLPADVDERLARIASSAPSLTSESRVIDVGSGTGRLIPHLQHRGVRDILAVDVAPPMLQEVERRFGGGVSCGNELAVRTWCGDFLQLPSYQGTADCIFFNAVFANFPSGREALLKATQLLRAGGWCVISHPMGREWLNQLHERDPEMVPQQLPDSSQLAHLIFDLPLTLTSLVDEADLYLAVLQVPPHYTFPSAPLRLEGPVVTGFGRGSHQLGVPTANLQPEPLQDLLAPLPQGVYFGWAQLQTPEGWPVEDGLVHHMVMNIGKRPTVDHSDAPELSVECHIMHKYSKDFYGYRLRVVALGYLRPEMRFSGVKELVQRIKADIGLATSQLSTLELAEYARDTHFIL